MRTRLPVSVVPDRSRPAPPPRWTRSRAGDRQSTPQAREQPGVRCASPPGRLRLRAGPGAKPCEAAMAAWPRGCDQSRHRHQRSTDRDAPAGVRCPPGDHPLVGGGVVGTGHGRGHPQRAVPGRNAAARPWLSTSARGSGAGITGRPAAIRCLSRGVYSPRCHRARHRSVRSAV